MPHTFGEVGSDVVGQVRRLIRGNQSFHLAVSETLEEWGSEEDDEAFRDL